MTALLVANGGGHIRQLRQLAPRLPTGPNPLWVTIDTPQTRSLLAGERVVFLRNSRPKDVMTAARNAVVARRLFHQEEVDFVASTGSSLAIAVLPLAVARGVPTYFIDSATRVTGPSLTGRVMAALPGIRCLTQYPHLADDTWSFAGSVFDGYQACRREARGSRLKVVVSVGTSEHYGFPRLLRRMREILPADAEVVWQTGTTETSDLQIDARPFLSSAEFDEALRTCDVLVGHAGTGTALAALEAGLKPILVPRQRRFGEHVDDHQRQIATYLSETELAVTCEADDISLSDLEAASSSSVRTVSTARPLRLPPPARMMLRPRRELPAQF